MFCRTTSLERNKKFYESNKHLTEQTKHSTAKEAATIAKKSNVNTLILGHYSTRYDDYELFRNEAKEVFENVELAKDGKTFEF